MNNDTTGSYILDQFRSTSNKLKKRFLKKPNVTEACESFIALGQHCENTEMPTYAGLCWVAAARCEGSLGNIPGETACLTRSARQYLSAEKKHHSLGCVSPSGENLQAALSCYAHAASRYPDKCPLTTSLSLEIVESLKELENNASLEMHLKNALKLSRNSLDTQIYCLEQLGYYYIDVGDYNSALDTFTELANVSENTPKNTAHCEILRNCEINQIFLLLILKPAPQTLSPELTCLLETYTWGERNELDLQDRGMSMKMYLLLQSLVLTCQSLDTSALANLEGELWSLLTSQQKDLLRVLVKSYRQYS